MGTLKSIHLDYDFSNFLLDKHEKEWSVLSYYEDKEKTTLPDTFTEHNTKINQVFWNKDKIDFDKLGSMLHMRVETVATIRQRPGQVLPWHNDHFYKIIENNPDVDKAKIVRANVFMDDWKTGHVLQIDKEIISNWKKGDGYIWSSGVYHLSGNLGLEDKYTLQISGILLD